MAKPTAVKVSVQCPHCGAHQLESAIAQSTYCRACGEHFEIGLRGQQQEHREEEEASDTSVAAMWGKFSGLFRDTSPRSVSCFECGTRQEVVRTATSSTCKSCGAYIDLQDFKVVSGFSRTIQTAGSIFVAPKGDLYSAKAICGTADIRGSMRGHLVCTGEASFKYKGRITGAIETDVLRVVKKSATEFVRPVRAREVHVEGEMSGRILASGTVHIAKNGRLTGSIFARGVDIEMGGEFQGELNIGENHAEEPSLLPKPPAPRTNNLRKDPQSELGFGPG